MSDEETRRRERAQRDALDEARLVAMRRRIGEPLRLLPLLLDRGEFARLGERLEVWEHEVKSWTDSRDARAFLLYFEGARPIVLLDDRVRLVRQPRRGDGGGVRFLERGTLFPVPSSPEPGPLRVPEWFLGD